MVTASVLLVMVDGDRVKRAEIDWEGFVYR